MGISLHKLKTIVSADQNFRGSCFMSQNASACDLFPSSNWERDILKIALLCTEQEKYSYKPLLKEKIYNLMPFPLDTESH